MNNYNTVQSESDLNEFAALCAFAAQQDLSEVAALPETLDTQEAA